MFISLDKSTRISSQSTFNYLYRKTLSTFFILGIAIPVYATQVIVPPSEQLVLRDIQQQVSAQRLKKDVTTLVGFGTRHTLSETKSNTQGIGAARRWIKSEFDKISAQCGGCLEVIYQKQTFSGYHLQTYTTQVFCFSPSAHTLSKDKLSYADMD